jgi:Arc/MetJ-type ribon-helix-helix transcriptional regulator
MEQVNERMTIRLNPEYVQQVSERARRLGLNRSEYIRNALDRAMEEQRPGDAKIMEIELSSTEAHYIESLVRRGWFTSWEKALRRMMDIAFEPEQQRRLEESFKVMARSSGQEVALNVTDTDAKTVSR